MNKQSVNVLHLDREEIKALKLFLTLFYIFLVVYDVFYYYLLPYFNDKKEFGLPSGGLGFWYHAVFFLFLPLSIFLVRAGKLYSVKYFYLFGFIFIDLINNILIYFGEDKDFAIGNAVELIFILFSPLFINKRFFRWTALRVHF